MPNPDRLKAIRDSVELVGRLSDRVVKFGPFSLGIDGVLSWIPGLGEIYSTAAAGFILVQGARAGMAPSLLIACGAMMASRTLISALPLAGPIAADLFTAHRWSARLIVRAIDAKIAAGAGDPAAPARAWPRFGLANTSPAA